MGTIAEVATHFTTNRKTVSDWKREGMPVTKSGRYSLDAIDQWLEERGKGPYSQSRQSRDGTKKSESELRAEILQLKLDKERGELLQTKVVLGIGRRQITEARTMLEELPQLVVARLPSEITSEVRDGIRGDVEQVVRNVQSSMSAIMDELTSSVESDSGGAHW